MDIQRFGREKATSDVIGRFGLLMFVALMWLPSALAQVQVTFEPAKKVFIAHEQIRGKITIQNLSGQDVVLDGNRGDGWLNFAVTHNGRTIPRSPEGKKASPTLLKASEDYVVTASVSNAYPIFSEGTYRIKAQVYFPPLRRYFESQISTVVVSDGQPFWTQVVGVPTGNPGAGSIRRHELLFFNGGQRKREVYYRLSDNDTGRVRRAYSLGSYLGVREAEKALDAQNRLHVLHMNAPQAYAYTVIDTSGKPEDQSFFFEDNGSRPQLMKSGGQIVVQGGITEEEKQAPFDNGFHKISERPPGMPAAPFASR